MYTDGLKKAYSLPLSNNLGAQVWRTGLSLKVYKLALKITFPLEKTKTSFTTGTQLLHSI